MNIPIPGITRFAQYMPSGMQQYNAYNNTAMNGIHFTITGVKENITHFSAISTGQNLEDYISDKLTELHEELVRTAPYDTHTYQNSIEIEDNEYGGVVHIGADVDNSSGFNYAKFIVFGARTLYHAAMYNPKHWPKVAIRGSMGIIHDVTGIAYDWEQKFDDGLNDVVFTQPRDAGGRFVKVFK
jgi:hypothetical protein